MTDIKAAVDAMLLDALRAEARREDIADEFLALHGDPDAPKVPGILPVLRLAAHLPVTRDMIGDAPAGLSAWIQGELDGTNSPRGYGYAEVRAVIDGEFGGRPASCACAEEADALDGDECDACFEQWIAARDLVLARKAAVTESD